MQKYIYQTGWSVAFDKRDVRGQRLDPGYFFSKGRLEISSPWILLGDRRKHGVGLQWEERPYHSSLVPMALAPDFQVQFMVVAFKALYGLALA